MVGDHRHGNRGQRLMRCDQNPRRHGGMIGKHLTGGTNPHLNVMLNQQPIHIIGVPALGREHQDLVQC